LFKNGIEDNSLLTIYVVNCDALVQNGGGAIMADDGHLRRCSRPIFT